VLLDPARTEQVPQQPTHPPAPLVHPGQHAAHRKPTPLPGPSPSALPVALMPLPVAVADTFTCYAHTGGPSETLQSSRLRQLVDLHPRVKPPQRRRVTGDHRPTTPQPASGNLTRPDRVRIPTGQQRTDLAPCPGPAARPPCWELQQHGCVTGRSWCCGWRPGHGNGKGAACPPANPRRADARHHHQVPTLDQRLDAIRARLPA
jgi:hypothetical protein